MNKKATIIVISIAVLSVLFAGCVDFLPREVDEQHILVGTWNRTHLNDHPYADGQQMIFYPNGTGYLNTTTDEHWTWEADDMNITFTDDTGWTWKEKYNVEGNQLETWFYNTEGETHSKSTWEKIE